MMSTPVRNSVEFLKLVDKNKQALVEDTRLTKTAELAATEDMILKSKAPDTLKVAEIEQINNNLRYWRKKVRNPTAITGNAQDDDGDEGEGPTQRWLAALVKNGLGNTPASIIGKTAREAGRTPRPPSTRKRLLPAVPSTSKKASPSRIPVPSTSKKASPSTSKKASPSRIPIPTPWATPKTDRKGKQKRTLFPKAERKAKQFAKKRLKQAAKQGWEYYKAN